MYKNSFWCFVSDAERRGGERELLAATVRKMPRVLHRRSQPWTSGHSLHGLRDVIRVPYQFRQMLRNFASCFLTKLPFNKSAWKPASNFASNRMLLCWITLESDFLSCFTKFLNKTTARKFCATVSSWLIVSVLPVHGGGAGLLFWPYFRYEHLFLLIV